MGIDKISTIYQEAANCRDCFDNGCAYSGKISVDYAQPRPIGPKYFKAKLRVLVVLVNPGSVGKKDVNSASKLNKLLGNYQGGMTDFLEVNAHLVADMPNWGVLRNRSDSMKSFCKFYFDDMGLDFKNTAFVNIALCGAKNSKEQNAYPSCLLKNCFGKFSKRLIGVFDPNLCIISGSAIAGYEPLVREHLSSARVESTYHYAYRPPDEEFAIESAHKIKEVLNAMRT